MILTGCNAIVVVPVDAGSLGAVLQRAKEQNIVIINYDLMALNTKDIDWYIGFDNKQVGKIQAQFIEERLGLKQGKGPFNMEVFAGSLDEVNAYWYHEEAMKILQPYIDKGQLVVKSGQTKIEIVTIPGWNPATTASRMENLVTTYYSDGTPLHVVLAPTDSIGVPIGNVLRQIGYGTPNKPMPIITGNNGNPSAIQSIRDGQMTMSIFKDTRNLATRTAEVIDAIAKGEKLVPDDTSTFDNGVMVIPAFLYGMEVLTIDNWKQLTYDSGYYTAEQLGIK
jgi:putative multiple sugar transport system substrate-binding protein